MKKLMDIEYLLWSGGQPCVLFFSSFSFFLQLKRAANLIARVFQRLTDCRTSCTYLFFSFFSLEKKSEKDLSKNISSLICRKVVGWFLAFLIDQLSFHSHVVFCGPSLSSCPVCPVVWSAACSANQWCWLPCSPAANKHSRTFRTSPVWKHAKKGFWGDPSGFRALFYIFRAFV